MKHFMAIDTLLFLKIAGASLGSSIAVVFKPAGDSNLRLAQRFVIGTIIGVIFSPILMRYLEWPREMEYWLSSSAACGLVGYLALQLLFSATTKEAAEKAIKDKTSL